MSTTIAYPPDRCTMRSSTEKAGVDISLKSIRHGFMHGDTVVHPVWDLDLDIPAGQFVCLVGPSGCGKTTLLGMVAGLVAPKQGKVMIEGAQVTKSSSESVAYMLARDALLPWLSAQDNVELGLRVRGVPKAERRKISSEWLARVGLADFKSSSILRLSQGMRQRVAIARTLALEPRCILMDEPFAALDAQTRVLVQQEFLKLWEKSGTTVIFVTHDLSEAILLGDRIILMSSRPGRIVSDIRVNLPRPRNLTAPFKNQGFAQYHEQLADRLRHEVVAANSEA